MDVNEAERAVVARPVASRPTCSNFKSFSELLAGAINASSPASCSETAVPAIRPKTVRFKPATNRGSSAIVSSEVELPRACDAFDVTSKSDSKPAVVYKPRAKLVSKAAVSLLANMGSSSAGLNRKILSTGVNVQQTSQNFPRAEEKTENLRLSDRNQGDDPKTVAPHLMANADRTSYDGYNWRKYGQKQVKGSDYPRSYYKCTHPGCPVKKKVERLLDGQIAEIVYKGEHNHSKPQVPKRNSVTEGLGQSDNTNTDQDTETQSRVTGRNEDPPSYTHPARTGPVNVGTSENSSCLGSEFDEGSKMLQGDNNIGRKNKRRKSEKLSNEAGSTGDDEQEARVSVQSPADSETAGDGFRWRKYGQKVVKGNTFPRSYYRCTSPECRARKYVERASDDPGAFITTYEGKHNHEMPIKITTTNPSASETDSRGQKPQ